MTCFDAVTLRDWRPDSARAHQRYMASYVKPLVKDTALFGGIDETDLTTLLDQCYLRTLKPGDRVYKDGDLPVALYLVISGCVELRLETPHGYVVKEQLEAGETFGDVALMGVQPQSDSAYCVQAGEVLALSSKTLSELNRTHPALFTLLLLNITRDVCRRLMRHDRDYTEWARASHSE